LIDPKRKVIFAIIHETVECFLIIHLYINDQRKRQTPFLKIALFKNATETVAFFSHLFYAAANLFVS